MITCKIEIVKVPGAGYRIQMIPDETQATRKEIHVASCINHALNPVFDYLMARGKMGKAIEAKDVELMKKLSAQMISDFDSLGSN
ncbi:MAG TPA: hypothetical protein VNL17_05780 [Verrucomicrobiae bacterium]|nr:hypothetical protein [Verrucomicrobiae bacterium]